MADYFKTQKLKNQRSILLLEDDLLLGESLEDFLDEEGYGVTHVRNGQEALDVSFETRFELFILDINVPLIDGLTLLKELRQAGNMTPAIFLTSHQDQETLKEGFANGADDYLKKPVDMDELSLRVAALMRRSYGAQKRCYENICIDAVHKTIMVDDKALNLSVKEYELMVLLLDNIEQVVTKDMIIDALWSTHESVSDGAIRVYINRVKSEIGSDKIENIRGIGYRLVP